MKNSHLRAGRLIDCPSRPFYSAGTKLLLLLALCLLQFQKAQAVLYMFEPFDYPPSTPIVSLTNAPPWSTNGTLGEANATQGIAAGNLSYAPLTQPTTTNSACLQWALNVKGERAILPNGALIGGPGTGSNLYCSFMFVKTTTNTDGAALLPVVGVVNNNTGALNSASTTIGGAVLNILSPTGGGGAYQLGIKIGGGVTGAIFPPGTQTYASGNTNVSSPAIGQTVFVVMKYTFSTSGPDMVALWVDPNPGSFGLSEPAPTTNDVAATSSAGFTANAATGLGFLQIRGGSANAAGILQMDNVRIGSTWADVTPTCITVGIGDTNSPADQSVSPGQTATFTMVVTGANPTYQWQTNHGGGFANITGATNVSYTTPPEVLTDNGLQFRCLINVACDGSSTNSRVATLTVENCVAAGAGTPTGQTNVSAGSTTTFTCPANGTHPTFQWQLNSGSGFANISGATNVSYTTPAEPVANNGFQFQCIVSVACNASSATSAPVTLNVVCNTAQVSSLNNQTVVAGHSATFSVSSTSSSPMFQWSSNNVPIPGATSTNYTTAVTTTANDGDLYTCTVTTPCDGMSTSTSAFLSVNCFNATIGQDITNTSVALGVGQTVTFTINAGNTSLPTFQWQTNNGGGFVNISGATNATYTTPPLALANNGLQYQCVVTAAPCSGTTATSSIASVSVFSSNAEFFSTASGNLGDPNTWEQSFDGGNSFNNPALYPPVDINSTNTVIQNGNTVTAAANVSLNHVVVQFGGQLSVNTTKTITLTTNGGGTALDVFGLADMTGTLAINPGAQAVVESGGLLELEQGGAVTGAGALTFKSGSVYQHNYTTTAGTIPTAAWNTGSTCQIVGITSATTTLAGLSQTFYNFVWNCPGQTAALPWGGSVPTNNGDFTFVSSGTGEVRISNNNSPALNVLGNFNLQGGHLTLASGTGKPTMNLSGNAVLSGGTLSNSLASAGATVNFVKVGTQSFANTGATIAGPINWVVKSNSILQCSGVLSSNLTLAAGGQIRLTTGSPVFQVIGNLTTTNNTVVVDLGGATLGNGTYPLMAYGGNLSGFFKSAPTIVNGSVTGVAFISTTTGKQVNLVVAAPSQPRISGISLAGTALNIIATNGIAGDSYGVLASTNIALPLIQWTPILENGNFDTFGNLNATIQLSNTLGTNAAQQFFIIQMPSP